jgi:hypothetical protein
MSYLSEGTSKTDYGVVKVGNFINVDEGIVSLEQDVSPNADVIFNKVESIEVYDSDDRVVTSVTLSSGDNGIEINSSVTLGPATSFTINNTGVRRLTAGPGIDLSASSGEIVVSATGADLISVYGTTTSYTATADDEYIGVSSASAVTITLPNADPGRVYYIKDEYGQGSGKITIQPQVGTLIDRKNNYIISVPHQSVAVVYRAGGWWLI